MTEIKRKKDLDSVDTEEELIFNATINRIESRGNKDEAFPMRINLKLEDSGENIEVVSWLFFKLDEIEKLIQSPKMIKFNVRKKNYKETIQIKMLDYEVLAVDSERKKRKAEAIINIEKLKRAVDELKKMVKNDFYRQLIDEFIIKNEKFFTHPAATWFHHNYKSGLAIHSINVCRLALKFLEIYGRKNINSDLLITASLLHDIGKIKEYGEDTKRTFIGDIEGHIFMGAEMISNFARKSLIDPYSDPNVSILVSCILSHHGKLEFGSPVTPKFIESYIISICDDADSKIDSMGRSLDEIGEFEKIRISALNGNEIYKLKD